MWREVLETYRCLVRAKNNLEFLKRLAKDSGYIEDETGLRGQYGGHRE
jgi:hypothetical protein